MRRITAFYAWQSDTPEKFNRELIGRALREAAGRINEDAAVGVEVHIDSDTEGVPGTPPVSETILAKIADCDIFVPDVTFVARTDGGKSVPNPNVMTEYGYALCEKSHAAMMPIMNTVFGPPEDLPFDMGHLRHPIQYKIESTAKDAERRAERGALSARIEQKLRLQIAATQPPPLPPRPFPSAEQKNGPARFRSAGEPIANRWDMLPFGVSPENSVSLVDGPAMWLRLMPTSDPGKKWPPYELRQHAISSGSLNLAPFFYSSLYTLRAEDGIGICTLGAHDARETASVAFAFETAEVWGVDTWLLAFDPTKLFVGELEKLFTERLQEYARFLAGLGLEPPYHWIGGICGVKGRSLEIPLQRGNFRVPGWNGPRCLSQEIIEQGRYDGRQAPSNALYPFFKAIYDKCGVPRPDYLPR